MPNCAYCNPPRPLTREHVWSNVLLRMYEPDANLTTDPHRQKVYEADPQLKDVCSDCNNVKLSPADTAVGEFAQRHLVKPIPSGTSIDLANVNLARWALKTSYNIERHMGLGRSWQTPLLPFMLGSPDELGNVDLLFAPWEDLSPMGVATKLGMVQTLDSRQLMFDAIESAPPDVVQSAVECGWALKVGSGVFAILVWSTSTPAALRAAVIAEIRGYGWLAGGLDTVAGRPPFSTHTCTQFNRPGPPGSVRLGGRSIPVDDLDIPGGH